MFELNFYIRVISKILDEINSNQSVRNFVRGLGEMAAELIPGEHIEPELVEFLDLFKEGVLKHEKENNSAGEGG